MFIHRNFLSLAKKTKKPEKAWQFRLLGKQIKIFISS